MPEEIEVPTEQLQETLSEKAEEAHEEHHQHGGGKKSDHPHHKKEHHEKVSRWIPGVALSSAIMAVLAALSALLAGHHANEGVLEQITAGDRWEFFQSKGIKASILQTKIETLEALGKTVGDEDKKKVDEYKKQQDEIQKEAKEFEKSSEEHMTRHNVFARTVTMFQIAIALSAIAVLSKRKWLWYCGLVLSGGGMVFLVQAFL